MNRDSTHCLRALILAAIMVLSIIGGGVAFAGSAAANDFEDLQASDGADGTESTIIANFDNQLPTGNVSGNDTLRVQAEGGTLPEFFRGELSVNGNDVSINTSQDAEDIELVVYGEDRTQASAAENENIFVDNVSADGLDFQVTYQEETPIFKQAESPVAVEISNLSFDAGSTETATLNWEIDNQKAQHALRVTEFDPGLEATDGDSALQAQLTGGAAAQEMAGPQGSSMLVLDGNEEAFPESFQATATIDDDAISFHDGLNASDITAKSGYGDVTVTNVSSSEIQLDVQNFDSSADDSLWSIFQSSDGVVLSLEGVTFDAEEGADEAALTWDVRGASDTFTLEAEYLNATFPAERYEVPRGATQQPVDGVEVTVLAEDVYTDGFHDYGAPMWIEIPADKRDDLSFDRSSELSTGHVDFTNATVVDDHTIKLEFAEPPWATWTDGDELTVSNIRFNVSGASEPDGDELTLESGLDVCYTPENALGDVAISSEEQSIVADVPEIELEGDTPTKVNLDRTSSAGSSPLVVNITDTTGGQLQPGTDVVIGLQGSDDLQFDASQDMQTDGTVGFSAGTIQDVTGDEIVVTIPEGAPEASQQGEYLTIEGPDGHGIQFDTMDAAENETAELTVRTSAGAEPVTQVTEPAVTATEERELRAHPERIPASGGDVNVTLLDSTGAGISNTTVTASEESIGTAETDENGNATFEDVALQNTVNETIAFTATIDESEFTTHVSSIAPRITTDTGGVQVGDSTKVNVTLETYEVGSGYVTDESNVQASAAPYNDTVIEQIDQAEGETTFQVNLTDETEDGTITFSGSPNDINVSTSIVAASDGTIEPGQQTLALGQVHEAVDVTVTDIDGTPQSGVSVTAANDDIALEGNTTTNSQGTASPDIDLQDVDEPATIELEAELEDGAIADTATGSIETATIRTDHAVLPTDRDSTVTVEIAASGSIDEAGVNVTTTADSAADTTTNDSGIATFELRPSEVETIGFDTTVDDADLTTIVETVDLTSQPARIGAGKNSSVDAQLRHSNDSVDLSSETVTADRDSWVTESVERTPNENGTVTYSVSPTNEQQNETLTFNTTIDGYELETTVDSIVPSFVAAPEQVELGGEREIQVGLTAFEGGEMVGQNETVTAVANNYDVAPEQQWTDDGYATFTANLTDASDEGEIHLVTSVSGIELEETIEVTSAESDDGGDESGSEEGDDENGSDEPETGDGNDDDTGGSVGGGGGGGGGGGAAPAPSPSADMNVTNVTLSTNEVEVGETVNVTVTVANEGDADGEYDVRVEANTVTIENQTVDVAEGETVEVTVPLSFHHTGKRTITVDSVKGGKLVVQEIEPENLPDSTVDADAKPIVDMDDDVNGTVVEFGENVTIDAIVFPNASNGTATVADLEEPPENLSVAPGVLVQPMAITVPDELENATATIRLSLSAEQYDGDVDRIKLARFNEDAWQILEPTAVETSDGELTYEFETPGFSTFAVFAQQDEDPQTGTTTTTVEGTATATDDGAAAEEAGFGTFGTAALVLIALLALLLAVAGARMYRQNEL